jgi:hypothetical protein
MKEKKEGQIERAAFICVMEIDESKLIEGATVWTAEAFLKYAKDANICLFT